MISLSLGFDPDLRELRNPEERQLGIIPQCTTSSPLKCTTIAYVNDGNDERVRPWVERVAETSNIPIEQVNAFSDQEKLNKHLIDNPNTTQAAYIFEERDLDLLSSGSISFTVQYNQTSPKVFPIGTTNWNTEFLLPTMVLAMNKVLFPAILNRTVDLNFKSSAFPHPRLETDEDDAFIQQGPFVLYAVYSLSIVFFLTKLVNEKEKKLRESMKLSGQKQSHHFLSWAILFLVSMTITTFLIIISGHIFRLSFFTRTQFPVYFFTFLIFSVSLIPWIFLYDLIIRKSQDVSSIVFYFFILFYLLAVSGAFIYATDENGDSIVTGGAAVLRELFALFPPVMFAKCIQDIATRAALRRGLSLSEIDDNAILFPIKTCWIWMLLTSAILMIIVVYLDNVVPNGYSAPLKPWYLFTRGYWGRRSKSIEANQEQSDSSVSKVSEDDKVPDVDKEEGIEEAYDGQVEDGDVRRQREDIQSGRADGAPLIIRDIRKQFGSFMAVDGISLSVETGKLMALLGHNGAGKSTLFNMLTGQILVSSGTASMFGLDVRSDQSQLRKLLGVCPQHDILWPTLTVKEHLNIYAALKGIGPKDRPAEIEKRLTGVGLEQSSNKYAKTLSGGMQRRLSISLALIADPRIVLLDEPSTGTDILAKKEVWRMVQAAKQDKVIILVTHSMSEAETLGDKIGIMAQGKLRVLGSSMHLKRKFGVGYRLKVRFGESQSVETITQMLTSESSSITLESNVQTSDDRSGVVAEYLLHRNAEHAHVANLAKLLEDKQNEGVIESFSLSQTTLEDVFIKITSMTEDSSTEERQQVKRRCVPSCCS